MKIVLEHLAERIMYVVIFLAVGLFAATCLSSIVIYIVLKLRRKYRHRRQPFVTPVSASDRLQPPNCGNTGDMSPSSSHLLATHTHTTDNGHTDSTQTAIRTEDIAENPFTEQGLASGVTSSRYTDSLELLQNTDI